MNDMFSKCTIALALVILTVLVFFVSNYYFSNGESSEYENRTYTSQELAIKFDYPSNLSLAFTPQALLEGNKGNKVGAIGVDQVLFLRTRENFEDYLETNLMGHDKREVDPQSELNDVYLNGKKLEFSKYIYGDGSPVDNCMWGINDISYIAELENNLVAEIKVEEQITCDSEKEYIYRTDPERINRALEVLKSVRTI